MGTYLENSGFALRKKTSKHVVCIRLQPLGYVLDVGILLGRYASGILRSLVVKQVPQFVVPE